MAASSENEFEGRVSGELSGEIFGLHHVHILENPNDVPSSPQKQNSTCNNDRSLYQVIFLPCQHEYPQLQVLRIVS